MSFIQGFQKIAGIAEGLAAAGKETVKDALKLKGAREAYSGIKSQYKGKMKDLIKTPKGRSHLGEAVAKSLPSAAAGAAYLGAGKKIYNAAKKDNSTSYDQYYS